MYYADCTCIGRVDLKKGRAKRMHIKNISRRNWPEWSPEVIRTMRRVFPRNLWWTKANFTDSFKDEKCIARLATIEGKFAGFSLGIYDKAPDKTLITSTKRKKIIHIYYIFLDQPYLHKGYGYLLLKDFAAKAQAGGYHAITVFAKLGPSVRNLQKLGARRQKVFEDFYETGETYIFCSMELAYKK